MNIKLLSFISLFVVSVSANASVVDLFTTLQPPVEDFTTGDGGETDQAGMAGDPSILGGYRDVYVDLISTTGIFLTSKLSVAGGVLNFSTDAGATGSAAITWDGANIVTDPHSADVAGGVDSDGLGGVDLTQGGTADAFNLLTFFSDGDFEFELTAWNATTGASTTITLLASEVALTDVPVPSSILFAAFSGLCGGFSLGPVVSVECSDGPLGVGVDGLTNVGAVQTVINTSGVVAIDLTLGPITKRTVPEPSSLALMGIALFSAGLRRKPANA